MHEVKSNGFRPIRRTRVSEGITEQVRDLIISGRLRPGDRLPAERDLARTLRVGRSVVREAIRAMEFLGIVEVRPGEGTFVAPLPGGHGPNPLTASLFQTWSTQRMLFEVRRVLEPSLAALAARRATAEQIAQLRTVLGGQVACIREGGTGVNEDTTFHFLIAQATGNHVLLSIVNILMDLLQKTREASLQHADRRGLSLREHWAILEAIEARDPAAAERRMHKHILEIEALVFSTRDSSSFDPGSTPASAAA